MKKRVLSLVLGVLMSITFISCGSTSSSPSDSKSESSSSESTASGDTIPIGVISPSSGALSDYGIAVNNAIALAIDEINASGGVLGKQIKATYLDDKHDSAEAVNCYNKLKGDKVVAVIGSVASADTSAIASVAAKDGKLILTPTSTNDVITGLGNSIFRACYTDSHQGEIMATFASKNLKAKTAGILYNTTDEYSTGLKDSFESAGKNSGLEITTTEGYGNGDVDFNTQLTKIASLNPDVLFVPDYYGTDTLIASQARAAGYTGPILGADGWDGVIEATDSGSMEALNNCFFSNHYSSDDTSEKVQNFIKAYKDKYDGKTPNALAALAYDSTYMVKEALEKAGATDDASIVKAMTGMTYEGVTGNIALDENRNPKKGAAIIEIKDGKYTWNSTVE